MRLIIVSALLAGACSTPDPCAGKSGTCIAARVEGNAQNLMQTRVTLPDGRSTLTQASAGAIKLPAQFAILIGDMVPASPFVVQLDGIRGGATVASDSQTVSLAGTRGSVKFTLNEAGGGGSGGGGGGSGGDMAVMNPPVLSGIDPVTVDELAPLTVNVTATDPLGSAVALSAASLPGNAMFDGASGKLTWTPSYTDAGKYTVKITATPDDPTRAATYDLVITVKNAADPILIAGNPVLTAVPIGDWDKDGFGDLATCTGDAAGATGKYHIQILYGSATGLPLDAASGAGRVDSFDIAAKDLGGTLYSCKGGDFDGDGHADIIFADPANNYWLTQTPTGTSPNQGLFTVIFGGARAAPPQTIFLAGTYNFGQHMGEVFDVGDFNGDGKADVATVWSLNANTAVLFNGGARINQMGVGQNNAQDYPNQGSPCAPTISVTMVDFNKDGNADWVLQDPGINPPSPTVATCTAGNLAAGGLRVITGRSTAPMLDSNNLTSFTEYYAPTGVGNERYRWGRQAAGCDVDADGYGDIGLIANWNAMTMQHGQVYYGSAGGLVATAKMPLGDTTANSFDAPSMQPSAIGCFGSYKNGRPALAVSGTTMVSGPGQVDFYAGRPLAKVGTMMSPSGGDSRFGVALRNGNRTDVDGDGKEDLVVISDQFGWVIYGR
ncbi:MAG: hypothetical protein JWM53_5788 [bacterium]|nr:hypothetical protein [bacterium]